MFCQMFHVKLGDTYGWTDPLALVAPQEGPTTEDGDVIP